MGFVATSVQAKAIMRFVTSDLTNGDNIGHKQAIPSIDLQFYTPTEFEILTHLANLIIPKTDTLGAIEAGVPVLMDVLYSSWASKQTQGEHKAHLKLLLNYLNQQIPSFTSTSKIQKTNVIEHIDNLAFVNVQDKEAKTNKTILEAYKSIKHMVTRTYYSTEVGASQELRYLLIPGKWDGCLPMTENTRTWA